MFGSRKELYSQLSLETYLKNGRTNNVLNLLTILRLFVGLPASLPGQVWRSWYIKNVKLNSRKAQIKN